MTNVQTPTIPAEAMKIHTAEGAEIDMRPFILPIFDTLINVVDDALKAGFTGFTSHDTISIELEKYNAGLRRALELGAPSDIANQGVALAACAVLVALQGIMAESFSVAVANEGEKNDTERPPPPVSTGDDELDALKAAAEAQPAATPVDEDEGLALLKKAAAEEPAP